MLSIVLLSSIYLVGERAQNELEKSFSQSPQNLSIELLSYKKTFLKATAIAKIVLQLDEDKPLIFTLTSAIRHYPYKVVIDSKINFIDPQLSGKVQDYFEEESWLTLNEEISLLGNLTGQLKLRPGSYHHADMQLATKMLRVNYKINLHNNEGRFLLDWGGMEMLENGINFSLQSVKLSSDFNYSPVVSKYNYVAEIAKLVIDKPGEQFKLQAVELQGNSCPGQQPNTLDSSYDWKVASYQIDNGLKKTFTDNHLQFDLKGLYVPALTFLNHASGDSEQVIKGLTDLMSYGGQLSITKLTSQTPWGQVNGTLDFSLQQGANLLAIINNPFILLDYTTGSAHLLLSESFLQLPALSEILHVALKNGFFKQNDKKLTLETHFEQGELSVNGYVLHL